MLGLAGRSVELGFSLEVSKAHLVSPPPLARAVPAACRYSSQLLQHLKAFLPAAMFPTMMAMESP